MVVEDIKEWFATAKAGLDLLTAGLKLLPKGNDRDELEKKIKEASEALARSDAALAKKLGYYLCKCTFPPQAMLWVNDAKTNVCPKCGHQYPPPQKPLHYGKMGGVV